MRKNLVKMMDKLATKEVMREETLKRWEMTTMPMRTSNLEKERKTL